MNMDVKKRGWVKNAAIVFLAVMLVLTFFSNTIRNRSLPEVAAQYTTSGTITARIRGSGTVSANESYEVKARQSRTVSERLVTVDDKVSIGDVLIRFEGTESKELEEARTTLKTKELDLEKMLIDLSRGDGALAGAARAVTEARNNLNDEYAKQAEINYNADVYNAAIAADDHAQAALAAASATAIARQHELTIAESELKALQDQDNVGHVVDPRVMEAAVRKRNNAAEANRLAQAARESASETADARQITFDAADMEFKVAVGNRDALPPTATEPEKDAAQALVDAAQRRRDTAATSLNSALAALATATTAASARQLDLNIAESELKALQDQETAGSVVDPRIMEAAIRKVNAAAEANRLAQAALILVEIDAKGPAAAAELAKRQRSDWQPSNIAVRQARLSLDTANASLALLQSNENIDSSLEGITLRELRNDIEDTKELIVKLEKEGTGSEITALAGGIVKQVNVSPGAQVSPDDILIVIEVVDRGYSVSFPVTAEQANRVNIGDFAEVDRSFYWRQEIRATLQSIRPDPQNPVLGRTLHFSLSSDGQIEHGTQLSLVIEQRSESYQIIVPNNAVREDSNGTFVLVVVSSSGPLGNRFIATRADVNVLAKDDTNTAVTGSLSGWDFVITHSNDPITPGMEVRLVDN